MGKAQSHTKLGERSATSEPFILLLADPSRRRERRVVGGSEATDEVHFYYSQCRDRFSTIY